MSESDLPGGLETISSQGNQKWKISKTKAVGISHPASDLVRQLLSFTIIFTIKKTEIR